MKTIKFRRGDVKVAGFTNRFVTYGKNPYGKYRIEVKMDLGIYKINQQCLYSGKTKPLFRNIPILTMLLVPLVPLYIIGIPLFIFGYMYFTGGYHFFKNDRNDGDTKWFNYMNIALLITLIILYISC